LSFALKLKSEIPTVICSYENEKYFFENFSEEFRALMAKKNVGFLRLPFVPETLVAKYKELSQGKKVVDELAIEINRINSFEKEMGMIQHSVSSFFEIDSDFAREKILAAVVKAREIGLLGSDSEVAMQIKGFRYQQKNSFFAGKFFPGVFCDLESTLIINGQVHNGMLRFLERLSESNSITLWTGGDIECFQQLLLEYNIFWKLVSKRDFFGAEVEKAFDDEDFHVFYEKYGIKVREFVKI
jgi:hypothetical protein